MKYRMAMYLSLKNQTGREIFVPNYLTVLSEQKYLNFLKYVDYKMMNGDTGILWK
jgi:CRISPR/Cas system-associated protein Cas10 (large subunit of type III CRISPR-Cas system)